MAIDVPTDPANEIVAAAVELDNRDNAALSCLEGVDSCIRNIGATPSGVVMELLDGKYGTPTMTWLSVTPVWLLASRSSTG